MKILHCLHNYYPATGGAEWLMKNVSEGLVRRGHTVRVIATNAYSVEDYFLPGKGKDRIKGRNDIINGVEVRRVGYSRRGYFVLNFLRSVANIIRYPRSSRIKMVSWGPRSRAYRREIERSRDFDLIAACPLPTLNVWYAWQAARKAEKPLVIIPCFHTEDKKTYSNPVYFQMMAGSEAVIALTEHERQYIHEQGHVPLDKIQTIGAGVAEESQPSRVDIRSRYGIGEQEIVLFLGQHGLHKGILHLVHAMTHVWKERPATALVIAGNPTAHTLKIEAEIERLPPEEKKRIYLIKGFPESEKRAFYEAADVFVSVSLFESFGIVFLEAWLSRLPVIGCTRGGSSRIIDNFRDGILVDFGKPKELAGAILERLENTEDSRRMGETGYRKVLEHYTWEKIVGKWDNLYQATATKKGEALRHATHA
jgi:glycogen synthase